MDFKSLETVHPYTPDPATKNLSIGYYGSQARFSGKILNLVDQDVTRYVDLVAGGMGTPYRFCYERDIPIGINDAGYFSHVWAKSVFTNCGIEKLTDKDFKEMLQVTPVAGYITNYISTANTSHGGKIKTDHAKYFDGLCVAYQDKPYMLAALAKLLAGSMTFRSLSFCGSTADGMKVSELPDSWIVKKLFRILTEIRTFNMALDRTVKEENKVCWGDASSFVKYEPWLFRGAHVYMDPAWPWNKEMGGGENPYIFTSVLLPQWLLQKEDVPQLRVWGNEDEETILNDIWLWTNTALHNGAKTVVVNTQSTNFPHPGRVKEFLQETFNIDTIKNEEFSGTAKTANFGEFFFKISLK
jgi:hypothetical protein